MKKSIQLIDKQDQVVISFSQADAQLTAGGEGVHGEVFVRNAKGEATLNLQAAYGNLIAGGHGTDGDLVLLDGKENARILIGANEGSFKVKAKNGETRFKIDGYKSDIKVKVDEFPARPEIYPEVSEIIDILDEKGHLPGMPSPEVMTEGFYLKDFSIKLMQEVELLTRIVAHQNIAIAALRKAIN